MKIGQVIREIRKAQGATLEEIALAADTNASNLSRIERGTQGYSPETMDRIAVALGTTVSALHLHIESVAKTARKPPQSDDSARNTEIDPTKYSALTQNHRELVDDFMTMLLRRQRVNKT